MSNYPEELPLLALMLLVRRSRQIGVSESELEKIFGNSLSFLLVELEERIKPLGLVLRHDPDEKRWFITIAPEYSDFIPGIVMSKTHAAVLATVLLLKAKSDRVKTSDVVEFLDGKVPREYVLNCLTFLKNEGYIKIREDDIEIGKRTQYEIDVDKFLNNVLELLSKKESSRDKNGHSQNSESTGAESDAEPDLSK
ncbi:MAG: hypothetical protein QXL15_04115 [Candidatus Korarchaeota archaeon]